MARARSRRPRRSPRGDGIRMAGGLVLGILALSILGGLGYVYATIDRPPQLDRESLCPVDGPRAITVVLIDASDPLPDVTTREARMMIEEAAAEVPPHGLFEMRLLDPGHAGGILAFSRCNPGDGSEIDGMTGNPEMVRRRWRESFREPLDRALAGSLEAAEAEASPIMATIQSIAVDRFTGRAVEGLDRRLIVVSDMLEHGPDYTQYRGDLSFGAFQGSLAHRRTRTDLKGASVDIRYVQRVTARPIDTGRHIRFWSDWVADSNGRLRQAVKLQGIDG